MLDFVSLIIYMDYRVPVNFHILCPEDYMENELSIKYKLALASIWNSVKVRSH